MSIGGLHLVWSGPACSFCWRCALPRPGMGNRSMTSVFY